MTQAKSFVDRDGDTWFRTATGGYSLYGTKAVSYRTFRDVRDEHGPLSHVVYDPAPTEQYDDLQAKINETVAMTSALGHGPNMAERMEYLRRYGTVPTPGDRIAEHAKTVMDHIGASIADGLAAFKASVDSAPTPEPFTDARGQTWYPHADGVTYCLGPNCVAARDLDVAQRSGHGRKRGDFIFTTPVTQTPEPGDRVRVTYEAEYMRFSDFFGRPLVTVDDREVRVPADATITVLESAKPVVPDEPPIGAVVMTEHPYLFFTHRYDETCGWVTTRGSAKYSWPELIRDYELYRVTRGEEIA